MPPEQHTVRFYIPPPEKASFQVPSISPDGRMLAFIANNQLWIRALDSLEARPLLPERDVSGAFWSSDSQFVGFVRQGKLQKVAVSGGPAQVQCDVTNAFTGGTWNGDGVIVFGQVLSLFRVSDAGGTPNQLTKGGEGGQVHLAPEFLPDGHHFLYTVLAGKAEAAGIFVGSLDGEPPARLLPDVSITGYAPVGQSGYPMFMRGDTLIASPLTGRGAV